MNTKTIASVVVVAIVISFVIGVYVGTEKIAKQILFPSTDDQQKDTSIISQVDVRSQIHIQTKEDVLTMKNDLISYIWKNGGFPSSKLPSNVEVINDERYNDLQNLEKVEKITIMMDNNVLSYSYLFIPKDSNKNLVMYHQGHDGDFIKGKNTIKFFLDNRYPVMAFSMPLLGMNNQPIINTMDFGPIKLKSHDYLKFLESQTFSPIKYFVEPIAVSLNYVDQNYNFDSYTIVGISGGGWTGVLYSALDDRISQTYSVAGSLPLYLRTESDLGDYEQTTPDLYRISNYLELYVLDSYGQNRKLVQIFNKYDPCCYANPSTETYENIVKSTLTDLGAGSFAIYIDDTHKEHKISDHALQIILESMKE